MANPTAANVRVGVPLATGAVLTGPLGTTVPVSATAAPNVALVATGYVGESGVVEAIDTETKNIVAWGGDTVRKVQTSHDVTYQWTYLETNALVLKEVYGQDNVTETSGAFAVLVNSKELPHRTYVLEIKDGSRRGRIVIPDGQITKRGNVTYVHTDAVKYDVTVTAYPDSAGNKAYIYWDDAS